MVDFHWNRKKNNVAPIHKKGDKQTINNHSRGALLPICGKISEVLLCDTMFNFFF